MKLIENPKKENWSVILQRPTQTVEDIELTVNQIFDEVKKKGDIAINKYTSLFDGIELESNLVTIEELDKAAKRVSLKLQNAIKIGYCITGRYSPR